MCRQLKKVYISLNHYFSFWRKEKVDGAKLYQIKRNQLLRGRKSPEQWKRGTNAIAQDTALKAAKIASLVRRQNGFSLLLLSFWKVTKSRKRRFFFGISRSLCFPTLFSASLFLRASVLFIIYPMTWKSFCPLSLPSMKRSVSSFAQRQERRWKMALERIFCLLSFDCWLYASKIQFHQPHCFQV